MKLGVEEIKAILPHREPFLLVDEVLELEERKRIVAIKRVRAEEYYFAKPLSFISTPVTIRGRPSYLSGCWRLNRQTLKSW